MSNPDEPSDPMKFYSGIPIEPGRPRLAAVLLIVFIILIIIVFVLFFLYWTPEMLIYLMPAKLGFASQIVNHLSSVAVL